MLKSVSSMTRYGVAVAALCSGIAVAPLSYAQTATPAYPAQSSPSDETPAPGQTMTAPASGMKAHAHGKENKQEQVEERIKTLHDKLKITPAEEQAWNDVAETMRDNEKAMHGLIKERHESTSMTAVDDLTSYQKVAQAHVDGLQKLIPVFQTLYNSMSDAQKKNADMVFGSFEGRGHEGHKHHKGMAPKSSQ